MSDLIDGDDDDDDDERGFRIITLFGTLDRLDFAGTAGTREGSIDHQICADAVVAVDVATVGDVRHGDGIHLTDDALSVLLRSVVGDCGGVVVEGKVFDDGSTPAFEVDERKEKEKKLGKTLPDELTVHNIKRNRTSHLRLNIHQSNTK